MNGPLITRFWRRKDLPVMLQTEAAECGLACLCMVASYWGHRIELQSLRRLHPVSLKGATLKQLMSVATSLGLQSRPLKLDMQHLSDLRTPCLLFWRMNHFVVLREVRRGALVIHDPQVGMRRISLDEASDNFTGVALELSPAADFQRRDDRSDISLASLTGTIVGLHRGLLQTLLLGLSLQACALVAPFYMQWMVDEAIVAQDRDLAAVLGLGFLALVAVQTAMTAFRSWVISLLASNFNFQWLGHAFAHLMKLPLSYFEKRHLGDIVSRFGSIQSIQKAITTQAVEAVVDGVLVAGTLVLMLLYSAPLSGIALGVVSAYGAARMLLFQRMRHATSEQILHAARQQNHLLESTRGVQAIRLFDKAEERRSSWLNALADQTNAELRVARLTVSYQAVNNALFGAERVAVIWWAALLVMKGQFSVGMMLAFLSYKDQFTQRTASLIDKLAEFKMMRLHAERVADILHASPERPGHPGSAEIDLATADIEFRGVSFQYGNGESAVVRNLDLKIPSGQCVALTGPSGSGKTTVVKLLLGLLEPTGGDILIGGIPLSRINLQRFRSEIGAVMQEDGLFAGSIADNICFLDPEMTMARVESAGRKAAIHAEIESMPMGYHTLVGDLGAGVSGGQRQRILLARALYREPKILVLDEATSHLDIWNEQAVNRSIIQARTTRIMVAHRPETIAMAQRVVLLHDGRIVEDVLNPAPGSVDEPVRTPQTA